MILGESTTHTTHQDSAARKAQAAAGALDSCMLPLIWRLGRTHCLDSGARVAVESEGALHHFYAAGGLHFKEKGSLQ